MPPAEALKRITVPDGFNVTLFAHEPDIRQPIAMTFDDRGRLWVCECYSYPDFKVKNRDRVVILEDTDGDGRHDKRTIFWDKGNSLTGIEFGYGGIWVCCARTCSSSPTRTATTCPDGEPEIVLDGWTTEAKHNVFNGLKWGPDGWLYGCHGILATSRVGRPGTPDDKRVTLNCCIWRYHPTRKTFEVVCHGTTNPWGIDFNEYGEGFFTNCVIDHVFHMIPGAHYKRMYGQDLNPYVYELMDAASDHLHWGGGHWTESRTGRRSTTPPAAATPTRARSSTSATTFPRSTTARSSPATSTATASTTTRWSAKAPAGWPSTAPTSSKPTTPGSAASRWPWAPTAACTSPTGPTPANATTTNKCTATAAGSIRLCTASTAIQPADT